ncbi:hypothetical protein LPJ70_004974, partial [Coemansia sp. RSA 2708]
RAVRGAQQPAGGARRRGVFCRRQGRRARRVARAHGAARDARGAGPAGRAHMRARAAAAGAQPGAHPARAHAGGRSGRARTGRARAAGQPRRSAPGVCAAAGPLLRRAQTRADAVPRHGRADPDVCQRQARAARVGADRVPAVRGAVPDWQCGQRPAADAQAV